jgi:hypothetical protein
MSAYVRVPVATRVSFPEAKRAGRRPLRTAASLGLEGSLRVDSSPPRRDIAAVERDRPGSGDAIVCCRSHC